MKNKVCISPRCKGIYTIQWRASAKECLLAQHAKPLGPKGNTDIDVIIWKGVKAAFLCYEIPDEV